MKTSASLKFFKIMYNNLERLKNSLKNTNVSRPA